MVKITNEYLIKKATSVINPKKTEDSLFGTVGCALLTEKGKVHLGVSIVTWSGMGFCAEHSAIAAMITNKEYKIKKIVALWQDEKGNSYIVPPCGRCREFMHRVDKDNLKTDIILAKNKTIKLKELLPYSEWSSLGIPYKPRL